MRSLVIGILAAVLMLAPDRAPGAPLAERAAEWSGDGKFRSELDGPVRAATCRLASAPLSGKTGFSLKGKCAAPSGSATLNLIVESRGNGRVNGAIGSSVVDGTIQLSGRETTGGVALVSREPLEIDGRSMTFQIEVKWPAKGTLTVNEWLTPVDGGATTQIVWITLSE